LINFKKIFLKNEISYSVNQPIFNEHILTTNCYQELQKNGWCEVINDKPDSLVGYITIKSKAKK